MRTRVRSGAAPARRADPLLPYNVEAEESVLGAILHDAPAALADVVKVLRPSDFYRPAHQRIFEAMLHLHDEGLPVDAITVPNQLDEQGALEEAGGKLFVGNLLSSVGTPASAGYYAQIVLNNAARRRAIESLHAAAGRLSAGGDVATVLAELSSLQPTLNGDRPMESAPTTWARTDLGNVVEGQAEDKPSVFTRSDGVGLIYPAKMHAFYGEPESGKSWLALGVCAESLARDQYVVFLDFEDHAADVVGRLKDLGVTRDAILQRFMYIRPEEPLGKQAELDLGAALSAAPAVVVVDGITEAMVVLGLDPLNNRDVAVFMERLPKRLRSSGAAVILVDHVPKAKDGRGRFAIGAQHKLAAIDGAAYSFETLRPFTRGAGGEARITITKDRTGYVRQALQGGTMVGSLHLVTDEDGTVSADVRPAGQGGLSPSRNRALEAARGCGPMATVAQIQDATARDGSAHPLRTRTVQEALADLELLGLVEGTEGAAGLPRYWTAK